jgi:hypothetical protein
VQRREFLAAAGLAAGACGSARASATALSADSPRLLLLSAPSADAGTRFLPQRLADCAHCDSARVHVSIDSFHAADGGAVLDDLALHAMFDLQDGGSAAFTAWSFHAGAVESRTDSTRFTAGRDSLRRFEIEYRLAGNTESQRETCALTRFDLPLLAPGHYVLLGPRRDGSRPPPQALRHSGDSKAPLANLPARDFDYLAFRVEALG